MTRLIKCLIISFMFFFVSAVSCSEKKEIEAPRTECEQIKDIVTDCLGIYRGALGYIKNCGNITLSEIESLDSCEEIFERIENKD